MIAAGQLFLGKLLGRMLMAGMQMVLILVLAGRFLFGVSWGNSPRCRRWSRCCSAAYTIAVGRPRDAARRGVEHAGPGVVGRLDRQRW